MANKLYICVMFLLAVYSWYVVTFRAESYIWYQSKWRHEETARLDVVIGRWVWPIFITILFTIMLDVWGVPMPWKVHLPS